MFRKLTSFKSLARNSRRRPTSGPRVGLAMESLEDRVLLAGFREELENDLTNLQGPLAGLLAARSQVPLDGNRLTNDSAAAPLKVFAEQKLTGISEKYDSLSAADKNNATAVGNALFAMRRRRKLWLAAPSTRNPTNPCFSIRWASPYIAWANTPRRSRP